MGDWPPDRVLRVQGPAREHRLYLWLVPADAAGLWHVRTADQQPATLALTQRYQTLTGTLARDGRPAAVGGGRVRGDRVEFSVDGMTFSGRVQGDDIIEGAARSTATAWPWSARRTR